jgi:hypothetical protein
LKAGIAPLQQIPNLDGKLIEALPRLDAIAPNTYAAMANNISAGMAFLQTKAPRDLGMDIKTGSTRISEQEMRKFQLYTSAVFNPAQVFQELQKGRIRPETVETLQAVYPQLYQQLAKKAVEVLSDPDSRELSWERKKQLSMAFGIPASPALAMGSQLQAAWQTAPHAEEVSGGPAMPALAIQPSPSDQLARPRG